MTDVAVVGGGGLATSTVSTSGATYYEPWFGRSFPAAANTTETNAQYKNRGAATLANPTINVVSNPRSTSTSFISRVNTANGNLAITISAGATGVVTDSTHSDSLADGDIYNYAVTLGASSEALGISSVTATLTNSSGSCFHQQGGAGTGGFSSLTTQYGAFAGQAAVTSTEANVAIPQIDGTTASNLQIEFTHTSGGGATAMGDRLAGANGNMTLSPGSTSGFYEDTTHTTSVSTGAKYNAFGTMGNGSNSSRGFAFKYTASAANQSIIGMGGTTTTGASAVRYWPPGGPPNLDATEANAQWVPPTSGTASMLQVTVTTNGIGTNQTWTFRVGGSSGNQVATITASTTGTFQDTTHSDSLTGGSSKVAFRTESTVTASMAIAASAFLFVTPSSGITGTLSSTLSALATSSAGGVLVSGSASKTLSALTSSAAATVLVTATGTITLAAETVVAHDDVVHGDASITLGALTSAATGTVLVTGSASPTLGALADSAAGGVLVQGSAAISFAGLAESATGGVLIQGAGSLVLGTLSEGAAANAIVGGTLAKTLGVLTVSADGINLGPRNGALAVTLSALSLTASGIVRGFVPVRPPAAVWNPLTPDTPGWTSQPPQAASWNATSPDSPGWTVVPPTKTTWN